MINFIKRILNIPYSTKGIGYIEAKGNKPWRAYIQYRLKTKGKKKVLYTIGHYDTKKEAIQARYKFIKNLI